MTTKKQAIINKIREVCPETMELKFGCKVIMKHNVDGDYDVISANYHGETPSFELSLRGKKEFFPQDVKEVLGTPLELSHLLRAVQELSDEKRIAEVMQLSEYNSSFCIIKILSLYNLSLSLEDNLDNDELCSFLYKLIC